MNLLENPNFEGCHNCTVISGWDNVSGDVSIKAHNPSPNETAVRFADPEDSNGSCPAEMLCTISQVESANAAYRTLSASWWWVGQTVEEIAVRVYGSDSPEEGFELVWVAGEGLGVPDRLWEQVPTRSTVVAKAYAHYRFELRCRFSAKSGCKFTGANFEVRP